MSCNRGSRGPMCCHIDRVQARNKALIAATCAVTRQRRVPETVLSCGPVAVHSTLVGLSRQTTLKRDRERDFLHVMKIMRSYHSARQTRDGTAHRPTRRDTRQST